MERTHRIALAAASATLSVAMVVALVFLGSATEGPLSNLFGHVGTAVGGLESRAVRAVRGPGRASEMAWLAPLRENADSLRRPDALLLGAYDDGIPGTLEGVLGLEERLATRLPLIQTYAAWGDEPAHAFPERIAEAVRDLGSIPVITWEPWLSTFENRLHAHLPLRDARDRGGLAAIARGDYDFYVDAWAQAAARYGEPLMLRFAHEMNDPYRYPWGPQHNGPEDFIAAWRRVVDRFRAAGATNVLWVWSPHVAYAGYEAYWPGDDYVDWVATGALNYGTVATWSEWWSFHDIFGRHYDFLAGFGKPVMVAEFGTVAVGGDRAAWYREALTGFGERYPSVHALLFFNVESDNTVTRQSIEWSFLDEPQVVAAVREGVAAVREGLAADQEDVAAAAGEPGAAGPPM